jgi:hypothetical protein
MVTQGDLGQGHGGECRKDEETHSLLSESQILGRATLRARNRSGPIATFVSDLGHVISGF